MDNTLDIPEGLSPLGRKAAQTVLDVMRKYEYSRTGGCRAFYTPKEWRALGNHSARGSELVVVYDGGELSMFFESYEPALGLRNEMQQALWALGVYAEPINSWCSAIYSKG